nr:MAG TPA_asm: hypothetical protein [Caudoviricetes sp.]
MLLLYSRLRRGMFTPIFTLFLQINLFIKFSK